MPEKDFGNIVSCVQHSGKYYITHVYANRSDLKRRFQTRVYSNEIELHL